MHPNRRSARSGLAVAALLIGAIVEARAQEAGPPDRPMPARSGSAGRPAPRPASRFRRLGLRPWLAARLRRVQATPGESDDSSRPGGPPSATENAAPSSIVRPSAPGVAGVTGIEGLSAGCATPAQPGQAPSPVVPSAPTPLLLNKALHLEHAPVRVFGWIENSFTGNANGTPRDRSNFSVFPNHLANSWQGNQYYFVVENPLEQTDAVNFGFRFDTLFGNDWQFTKDYGLFDRAFPQNHFAGIDLPQLYGEVHLPVLTPGGLDLRGGRFYSLTGFENAQAIARPLLSVPYSMNFTPFTYVGSVATLHLSERVNVYSGTINGFDRWLSTSYKWGYMGGLTWASRDKKTTLVLGGASVPDQLPRFAPANAPEVPVGVPSPPFLAGRINPFYGSSYRGYISCVLTHNWTAKLTQAMETDHVYDPQVLGIGPNPAAHSASYHGMVNWFLYKATQKVTAVWRSEVFWDPYGLATGDADTFYEMTLGLNIRPRDWLWVRPEARYDWAQHTHPFSDGTRGSQLTLSFDVIVLF